MTRTQDPAIAPDRDRRSDGFVLVEAVLALVVVVLGVWLAVDLIGRVAQRRRCDRFTMELREISAAFERYARQSRAAPASAGSDAALPPPLAASLKDTAWFQGSPFGGVYEWIPPAMPDVANRVAVPEPATAVTVAFGRETPAAGGKEERTPGVKPGPAVPASAGVRTRTAERPTGGAELGAIALTAFSPNPPLRLTRADMAYVDRQIDDGNLASGRFRAGFNGWPVYTLGGK